MDFFKNVFTKYDHGFIISIYFSNHLFSTYFARGTVLGIEPAEVKDIIPALKEITVLSDFLCLASQM